MNEQTSILIRIPQKEKERFEAKVKKKYPNIKMNISELIRSMIYNWK